MRFFPAILFACLLAGSCYQYELVVTQQDAELRRSASHEGRIIAKLPEGKVLTKIKKIYHWYKVKVAVQKKGKTKQVTGYVYKDAVRRTHHNRGIYERSYREDDTLALMLSWPIVFIVLAVWIAVSRSRKLNVLLVAVLIWVLLVQTIYVLATDNAALHRMNSGFRTMITHINKIKEKKSIFIYFTDVTWPARIEVLTGFGMKWDRFQGKFPGHLKKRGARMRYVSASTNLSALRGRYVITDSRYYPTGKSWALPSAFYSGNFPSNWSLVKRVGSARLYYVR